MAKDFLKYLTSLKKETVQIGDTQLFVKVLTVAEATDLFKKIDKDGDNVMFEAQTLCEIILDSNGEKVFDSNNGDDLNDVRNLPFWMVQQVVRDFQDANFGNLTKK